MALHLLNQFSTISFSCDKSILFDLWNDGFPSGIDIQKYLSSIQWFGFSYWDLTHFCTAFKEAYEEFKHVLLAFIYDKDDQSSPVANEVGSIIIVVAAVVFLYYSSHYLCSVLSTSLFYILLLVYVCINVGNYLENDEKKNLASY